MTKIELALITVLLGGSMTVNAIETKGVNPQVISGLEISVTGSTVTVGPGKCVVAGKTVEVPRSVSFLVEPAGSVSVVDEAHRISSEKPVAWSRGTRPKGLIAGGTALPGCLVPGSVVIKAPDGSAMEKDKDYYLDDTWAGIARLDGGRLTTDSQVLISYRVGQMRIDAIMVGADGRVSLVQGKPKRNTPLSPVEVPGAMKLAQVFMPYNATRVEPWQVFVIGEAFREPDAAEMRHRSEVVSTTLAKLRQGENVTIVTWGDSVTAGGDASRPELAYAPLFITRLKERFPNAQIKYVNAGIGGTHTDQRLPALEKEVLAHKPDLVTIEFVNDMGFDADHLRRNYGSIVTQLRGAGAEIILITPHFTMPEWMKHPHPRGAETRPAVGILREFAKEAGIGLADTSKRWEHLEQDGLPYTALLENGINHPDDRGHELFVKDLMTFFPE
jgi:lysophospholipase L1-like esterase